jgi:hypothetical protein
LTGLVLVFAFGFAVWFWINRDGNSNSADAAPQKGMSERVMASRGFIPPGAPLRAPPRPAPRHGAVAVGFDQLAGFEFSPESGVVPDAVQALEGRLVEVIGVMYYSVPDPARVTEFFLMPDHSVCCFGTPRANHRLLPRARALARGAVLRRHGAPALPLSHRGRQRRVPRLAQVPYLAIDGAIGSAYAAAGGLRGADEG